jgi:altronate dehydratase small subunit
MSDKKTDANFGGTLDALMVSQSDNVAVCLHDIEPGTEASVRLGKENFAVIAVDSIPRGHKLALGEITQGENIVKYGEVIGKASANIVKGHHVHVHNVVD